MSGPFPGQETTEGADKSQNEPPPNRLSLGASIIHVPARFSLAQNRSWRFSVTYICWEGLPWAQRLGGGGCQSWLLHTRTIHLLCFAPGFPHWVLGLAIAQRSFSSPPVAVCAGRLRRQAGRRGYFPQPGVRGRPRHFGFLVPAETAALLRDRSPARGGVGEPAASQGGNFIWV